MSDDEVDLELLELLKKSLGIHAHASLAPSTRILESAEYVYDNSIDVSIVSSATKSAAERIWQQMQEKQYSTHTWSEHELHPKAKDEATVNFIFTMDLLNFSFWSERGADDRFCIEYKNRRWTGYWSLIAALQRALEEDDEISHVFRSGSSEPIPLLSERIAILRDAAQVLREKFDDRPINIIENAQLSAAVLVNLLVDNFQSFRDEHKFHGKTVRIHKRAQILVADLWACFDGTDYGAFDDIASLTIFADYRIPQMLNWLGVLWYSPRLESRIKRKEQILSGETVEVELRGCSIWAVELLKREIVRRHPEAQKQINAILIDFFLYDTCKEREELESDEGMLAHHRTRSIFY